jgi:antirestriction protein ArdC
VITAAGLPNGHRAKTIAHELGHIVLDHGEQSGDYHSGAGGRRGAMEVEAESVSHVLLRMNGMDPSETTGRYSAGWASVQSDDPDVVRNAAARVQLAVKTLISERVWRNVQGSGPKEEP